MDIDISNYRLAEYCEEAYNSYTIRVNNVEVCIQVWGPEVIIGFRGTQERMDWIRDLRFWPNASGRYVYHSGFWRGAKAVRSAIMVWLDEHGQSQRPLVFTGHSLGAGLALCSARQFVRRGYTVKCCVGFGAPRAMSRVKSGELGFDYRHYRRGNDVVSKCLPMGILYKHPCPPILIGKAQHWYPNWDDHSIRGYVKALYKKWRAKIDNTKQQ